MQASKVKSSDAFSWLWKAWNFIGVYATDSYNKFQLLHAGTTLCFNVIFMLSFTAQLFFMDNLKVILENLPMQLSMVVLLLKYAFILKRHGELEIISKLVKTVEMGHHTPQQQENFVSSVKLCHRIFGLYLMCNWSLILFSTVAAALSHQEKLINDIWLPFDWKTSNLNYVCALTFETIAMIFFCVQTASTDVCAPTYFIVLTVHLKIMMERIENINNGHKKISQNENYCELVACIRTHRCLMRIFDTVRDTITYPIFVQFLVTSIVIVSKAVIFLLYPPNAAEMASMTFFVIDVTLQILPCCYYSNRFMALTDDFVTSVYSCNWYNQSPKFKQLMIIFMQMTQKPKVVIAGKIVPVTLASFVSLMKMTYSLIAVILSMSSEP